MAEASPLLYSTTARGYQVMISRHITPALGSISIWDLSVTDLDRFYYALATRDGLSDSTIRQIHSVIHQALDLATRRDWIPRNRAALATIPKLPRTRVSPPTLEQVQRLIKEATSKDPSFGTFLELAATTGARRGELCALRWSQVDFESGTLTIDTTIAELGGLIEKDRSPHACRRITLDSRSQHILREQLETCQSVASLNSTQLVPDAFVFSLQPDCSRPWSPDWVTRHFGAVRTAVGLKKVHLRDFRHFSAAQMMAKGVPVTIVAGRLGHANAFTTLTTYGHFAPASDHDAARFLGSELSALKQWNVATRRFPSNNSSGHSDRRWW
ncbi:MAG: site-specific integrase [Acidimicrobiaceae bacterium]|nr:site-specific integrase [Acidimicrobiaceae bacterium]